jgi:7-dehydrocholesterol reductase
MIFLFITFQCVLIRIVPGPTFVATMTPHGHRPTYTANGLSCYLITIITLILLDQFHPTFRASIIYDKFGHILSSMNVMAFIFCIALVIKGYTMPSGLDSGTTGSIVQDFYWGTELYPRIGPFDVKQMTNCRCGMMFWAVAIIAFGYKNMELQPDHNIQYGMAISILLQLIYITKFFHWEMGYMCR